MFLGDFTSWNNSFVSSTIPCVRAIFLGDFTWEQFLSAQ